MCPDGNEGECSNGGTANASSGRARPISCFPATVISSEPPPAATIRMTGVQDLRRTARTTIVVTAITGIPMTPPMSV